MGKVYLVGAGPGNEGLITLKGMELLKQCDAVIYDRLVSPQLLNCLKKDCHMVYVGKEAGNHSMKQADINKLLIEYAKTYKMVVRLKGGDPFVFGRGGEEAQELISHGIPFEVVPGVTSAIAVPAAAGIPVTHRGISQSFHVITGHTMTGTDLDLEQYQILAKLGGTLIFLMGLASIDKIVDKLLQSGKSADTPVAVISNGTTANQITVRGRLATIVEVVKKEQLPSPAIIVIGETAKLNYKSVNKINYQAISKTASLITIGITGTELMRKKLREKLEDEGYQVLDVCDMKIVETAESNILRECLKRIDTYNWLLFTSQNAIRLFFTKMNDLGIDHRRLSRIKFAVIGSGSKDELRKHGYLADFIPNKYTTRDLAYQFSEIVANGEKVLIPRARQGSKELLEVLTKKEIAYQEIPFYDVVGQLSSQLDNDLINDIDCFVFASASGVNSFFKELNKMNLALSLKNKIACIGKVTSEAVIKFNNPVDIIANECDVNGLVSRINDYMNIYGG